MACKLKPTFSQVSSSITDTGYFPRPTGYVNDFARMFTMEQVHTLDSIIRDYEKRTTVEISIVTLDSSMVGQQDFDQYTLKLANYWGVGKKETKNGVLIAYAPYLRRIRINNGFGIE
ncbi:MAG TPA: TPM domain-containing protein, partial [Flavipsychrobacter sp.]|nr:TPM domain-containing protein [Flavipsychrobacter sp.]